MFFVVVVVCVCRYQITVSARTSEGRGPESGVVYVGMEIPTAETTPTSAIATPTLEIPTAETTPTPAEATPTSSPTVNITTSSSTEDDKDAAYYIIRIVPPVIVFIALVILTMGVVFYILRLRFASEHRKRVYQCKSWWWVGVSTERGSISVCWGSGQGLAQEEGLSVCWGSGRGLAQEKGLSVYVVVVGGV